jgi:hypothetical protein
MAAGKSPSTRAETWSTLNNQPTAQFYRVNTDNAFPYNVYGGQQDNSSVVIASRGRGGISEDDWRSGPGCESAFIAFDPDDPTKLIGGCYQGIIGRTGLRNQYLQGCQAVPFPEAGLRAEGYEVPLQLERAHRNFSA